MRGNMDTNFLGLIIQEWIILLKPRKIWDITDIFL